VGGSPTAAAPSRYERVVVEADGNTTVVIPIESLKFAFPATALGTAVADGKVFPGIRPSRGFLCVVHGWNATVGVDFALTPGTEFTTTSGGSCSVDIFDDGSRSEGNETFALYLVPVDSSTSCVSNWTEGASINFTIVDGDSASPGAGIFAFANASIAVNEDVGAAVLWIERTFSGGAGAAPAASVTVSMPGGNATGGGIDYTSAPQVINFSVGQLWALVSIPIINDVNAETVEVFGVALSAPSAQHGWVGNFRRQRHPLGAGDRRRVASSGF
jgi:hypothetical protein